MTDVGNEPYQEDSGTLALITEHHSKFVSFLSKRIEDFATAEDIFQSAYIKVMEHHRKKAVRERVHEEMAAASPLSCEKELRQTVCECIGDVVPYLKREYCEAIEKGDLWTAASLRPRSRQCGIPVWSTDVPA